MKKKTEMGTSGGVSLGGGTTGQVNGAGNVGYQHGPLTLFGSYGLVRDNRPRSESLFRENLYLAPETFLDEASARSDRPRSHTLTGSGEYRLGTRDALSGDLLFSTRGGARENTIQYRNLDAARLLTGRSDELMTGDQRENSFEAALTHKHSFAGEGHELSAELRTDVSSEGGTNRFTRDSLQLNGTTLGSPERENQTASEGPVQSSLQLDYTRPLGKHARLEMGYKGSVSRFHTTLDTELYDYSRSAFLADPTQSSDFSYDQQVHAAYGLLHQEAGSFAFQPGLRLERATTRFGLKANTSEYRNAYDSFFPSALVAWVPDENRQVTLSYSKRIRRPDDVDLLDPTLHSQDPLNVSRGNPALKPEYIHALELSLQRSTPMLTLQLTPFFRRTVNAVRRIRTIDDLGVATTTFANVASSDAYGSDFNLTMRQGRLTGFAGASAFRQVSDAANLSGDYSASSYGWSSRANVTMHATALLDVQALLNYRAPMTVEQGRQSGRTMLNLAVRQKLQGNRTSLTLRVVDALNTNHEGFTTIDPRFTQESDRRTHARGLFLSVSYNFGKSPREKRPDNLDTPEPGGG